MHKVGAWSYLSRLSDVGEAIFTRFQPVFVKRLFVERIVAFHWIV